MSGPKITAARAIVVDRLPEVALRVVADGRPRRPGPTCRWAAAGALPDSTPGRLVDLPRPSQRADELFVVMPSESRWLYLSGGTCGDLLEAFGIGGLMKLPVLSVQFVGFAGRGVLRLARYRDVAVVQALNQSLACRACCRRSR